MNRKKLSEKVKSQKLLKYVPNFLTLCNCTCGFIAILYMLQVYEKSTVSPLSVFAVSAWIILFAMIFDMLDGFAARIFNAASMHGMQMDSLADMVTFGVAPATICAIMSHKLRGDDHIYILVYILCALYMGGAALRLATYNVKAMTEKKSSGNGKFSGLPSPGAAAGVCSLAMLLNYLNIHYGDECPMMPRFATYIPIYATILGGLMVSTIPYPHMGKWFFSIWRNPKRLALFVAVITVICVLRSVGLFILINAYIFSSPIAYFWRKIFPKKGQ